MTDQSNAQSHSALRGAVRELCAGFPDSYWRELDKRREYPDAFVKALTEAHYDSSLLFDRAGNASATIEAAFMRGRRLA